MNTKQKVDTLWQEMREAINQAYATADKGSRDLQSNYRQHDDGLCLRDYAENISWSDSLARLLGRETANERQHRNNRPSVPGFSNETAAKLILMEQMRNGAEQKELPRATAFLVLRQTAVEAQVIGFLIRSKLTPTWRESVASLDYSKLMQGGAQ